MEQFIEDQVAKFNQRPARGKPAKTPGIPEPLVKTPEIPEPLVETPKRELPVKARSRIIELKCSPQNDSEAPVKDTQVPSEEPPAQPYPSSPPPPPPSPHKNPEPPRAFLEPAQDLPPQNPPSDALSKWRQALTATRGAPSWAY